MQERDWRNFKMYQTIKDKKKDLKNAWLTTKNKPVNVEELDTFLIEIFVLYSYDHKDEPPFLLGKDLQKALNLSYNTKFKQVDRVLGDLK